MSVPILLAMYVLLLPGVAVFLYHKHRLGADSPLAVGLKAACTTLIVLVAVVGTAESPARAAPVLITAGLVLGLVGDVVICQKADGGFLSGMIYFALGHLCYIGAFLTLSDHILWAVPIFLAVYLPLLCLAWRLGKYIGSLLIPVAVYGAVIVMMLSLSVTVAFSSPRGPVLLVAAVLFSVSDGLLAYNTFRAPKERLGDARMSALQYCRAVYQSLGESKSDSVSLYCYYIGQSLFAVSLYLPR